MKKIALIIVMYLVFFVNGLVFGDITGLDNLERSFKDMERSMKYKSSDSMKFQRKNQFPRQQDLIPRDQPATDKAMIRNQQRLKEMMDAQKMSLGKELSNWGFTIPKKYRLIIELFAIALFITFFSFMFYKQKIKRREEEKMFQEKERSKEEQGSGKDLPLYKY